MKRKICKSEFNTSNSSKVIKTSSLLRVSSRYSFTTVARIFSLHAKLVVVFNLRVTYYVSTKTRANTKYETLKLKLAFVLVLAVQDLMLSNTLNILPSTEIENLCLLHMARNCEQYSGQACPLLFCTAFKNSGSIGALRGKRSVSLLALFKVSFYLKIYIFFLFELFAFLVTCCGPLS